MNEPNHEPVSSPEETSPPEDMSAPETSAAGFPIERTLAELAPPSYECPSCGYIYVPADGDKKRKISPDTLFSDLPEDWRCPVCRTAKINFKNIGARGAPSGFAENLKYGFGGNKMTSGQKLWFIFGGLVLVFLFFMSLYGLN